MDNKNFEEQIGMKLFKLSKAINSFEMLVQFEKEHISKGTSRINDFLIENHLSDICRDLDPFKVFSENDLIPGKTTRFNKILSQNKINELVLDENVTILKILGKANEEILDLLYDNKGQKFQGTELSCYFKHENVKITYNVYVSRSSKSIRVKKVSLESKEDISILDQCKIIENLIITPYP